VGVLRRWLHAACCCPVTAYTSDPFMRRGRNTCAALFSHSVAHVQVKTHTRRTHQTHTSAHFPHTLPPPLHPPPFNPLLPYPPTPHPTPIQTPSYAHTH
jgi:hypothetical protein